jgi:hypothetical protein
MTISIPAELQARVRRTRSVNWSAVAAAAFEAKLTEVHSAMRREKVKKVVRSMQTKPPKLAELKLIGESRTRFLESIEYQAEWRDQKAIEYPDDKRNKQSAERLRQLAQQLGNIPPNDSLWVRYARLWARAGDSGTTEPVERDSEQLRAFGFYGTGPAEMGAKDAVEFLRGHVEGLEELVAEAMVEDEG